MNVENDIAEPIEIIHELVMGGFQPQAVVDLLNSRSREFPPPYTGGKLGVVVHVEHKGARLYCNAVMAAESMPLELIPRLLMLRFHPQAVVDLLNSGTEEASQPFTWSARGFEVVVLHKGTCLFSGAIPLFGR
jgi:hypothetical protein